jgi:hypothetical protein
MAIPRFTQVRYARDILAVFAFSGLILGSGITYFATLAGQRFEEKLENDQKTSRGHRERPARVSREVTYLFCPDV